ncbi:Qat anti-phage system associated protein QatB [Pedobacter sp. ASV1-7]|uniref:Qat anti-phage system associated protein QatB n=1 Tax=Pedobacter sp. ASV1-7 TaxID=3145237 RepID=UPI0032E912CF
MGTSSMYGGYSGSNSQGNPLLPSDFDENETDSSNEEDSTETQHSDDNEDGEKRIVSWQTAKTAMSKFASGSSGNIKNALSSYVKAHGGAKSASKTIRSAIVTTKNIGSFINSVSTGGLRETLDGYSIDYENRTVSEVLSELINYLAPSPITKDDSIARKALILTMENLYNLMGEESLDLDSVTGESLNFLIPKYVESFIYERLINDLGSRIETADIDFKRAVEIENDLKDYIVAKVEVVFRGKDFTTIVFTNAVVESLYNQCYTVMEDMI